MARIRPRTVRILTAAALTIAVLAAGACKLGWGTLCTFGKDGWAYLCPLGFLQTAVAGRVEWQRVWLPLVLTVGSIVVFGRYFCAWVCPTTLLKGLFHRDGPEPQRARSANARREAPVNATPGAEASITTSTRRRLPALDERHLVLAVVLVSSAVFRFPVFCLVCPVGLTFGAIFALGRLFSIQQPSLELLLYPTLLALEVFALRRWCRSFCPLGALLSLLSAFNPFFRPAVNPEKCLRSSGVNCQACHRACPQEIDLPQPTRGRALLNCSKCMACADRCPKKAISFPFWRRQRWPAAAADQRLRQAESGESASPLSS